jgi:hypothetical protein
MQSFTDRLPTLDNYWRSVILFGQNVASYKFALGKSLLELAAQGKDRVTLEELAAPFATDLCEHLSHTDKQATSQKSKFLDACRAFNRAEISKDELLATTYASGSTM